MYKVFIDGYGRVGDEEIFLLLVIEMVELFKLRDEEEES